MVHVLEWGLQPRCERERERERREILLLFDNTLIHAPYGVIYLQ